MKPFITMGCLMMVTTAFAQQSPQTTQVDSLKNPDNMPVIRDAGNPAPMPVRQGAGTAVAMPTRGIPRPTGAGEESRKLRDLLNDQSLYLRPDSVSREKSNKRQPPKNDR